MPEPRVALAVVTSPLGVLLIRRRDRMPLWGFPGGAVESGETVKQAAEREVFEEAGLLVRASHIIGRRHHPTTGRVLVYIAAQLFANADAQTTDPAIAEIRWASVDEVRDLLPDLYGPVAAFLGVAHV